MLTFRSPGQDNWPRVMARDQQLRQGWKSLKPGLFPAPTRYEHTTKHRWCLSRKLEKNSRSKPCMPKKVPQKNTESNDSCMIKRPGCPEPRAQAVLIQSVYLSKSVELTLCVCVCVCVCTCVCVCVCVCMCVRTRAGTRMLVSVCLFVFMSLCVLQVGLDHIKHSIVEDKNGKGISGGQKRRLAVAIQLIQVPTMLFLDEPTSGEEEHTKENQFISTLKSCVKVVA